MGISRRSIIKAAAAKAEPDPGFLDLKYEPKVILELKRAPTSGGCG
jgi:hypothetical protein